MVDLWRDLGYDPDSAEVVEARLNALLDEVMTRKHVSEYFSYSESVRQSAIDFVEKEK